MAAAPAARARTPLAVRLAAVLIFNAVPLVGVLWLGWSVAVVMLLYWAENVVVGVFALVRMLVSGAVRGPADARGAVFLGAFFVLHYGAFCTGHLIFVVLITLGGAGANAVQTGSMFVQGPKLVLEAAGVWGVGALAGLHAVFFIDWLRRGGPRRDDPRNLMGQPYARMILLHLAIIAGGAAAIALGAPVWSVVVLVTLKTAYDAGAELFGARRRDRRLSPA